MSAAAVFKARAVLPFNSAREIFLIEGGVKLPLDAKTLREAFARRTAAQEATRTDFGTVLQAEGITLLFTEPIPDFVADIEVLPGLRARMGKRTRPSQSRTELYVSTATLGGWLGNRISTSPHS